MILTSEAEKCKSKSPAKDNGHRIKLYNVSVTLPHELTYIQTYTPLASSSSSVIVRKRGNSVSGHLNLIAGLSGGDDGVTTLGLSESNCVLISFVSCVINLWPSKRDQGVERSRMSEYTR
ncbi:hypothetical protein JB92DRAFT_2892422 [Gautieria morchelliformis]|nr:hypothetical protein JB92DRAFT_2892422 [Gautieria morchelliformis]